jgi:hypothetical protein
MRKTQMSEDKAPAPVKPFEEWAKLKNTHPWVVAAAKMAWRWGGGRELTEKQYDAGIHRALTTEIG